MTSPHTVPDDQLPPVGTVWAHRNGNLYKVLAIANYPGTARYPCTVVYEGPHHRVWSRRASDWHRSMTRLDARPELVNGVASVTFPA